MISNGFLRPFNWSWSAANARPLGSHLAKVTRQSLWFLLSALVCAVQAGTPDAQAANTAQPAASTEGAAEGTILQHRLALELSPEFHEIIATDDVVVQLNDQEARTLDFSLNGRLKVETIELVTGSQSLMVPFTTSSQAADTSGRPKQMITLQLPPERSPEKHITLKWKYGGVINDPPRESRHLRFVTPSDTAGHIGAEGIYLSGETLWYPDKSGSLPTYRVKVTLPDGWTAVTHGRELARSRQGEGTTAITVAEWDVTANTEALTLVANQFSVTRREWEAPDGRRIEIATYLFPEDDRLAEEYIEATAKYLKAYGALLGPYPFPKFAVVENFFASGLGMPSFTLLGSGVIKRHYTQPYALGHEIVHSWIGNSVFNRIDRGNWVEGLTTYLANYYWHELNGDPKQAREQRRLMVQGYSVYVTPGRDYPVGHFTQKRDERDNAIGYQKAAMVFHLLREEIGDHAFWDALRRINARYQGRYADWKDIEEGFAAASRRDLRWFFEQWVEREGAPVLSIHDARLEKAREPAAAYRLTVSFKQKEPPYRLHVPVVVHMEKDTWETVRFEIASSVETHTITMPMKPSRVELDPDMQLFRRIERTALPPMLNVYVTDPHRSVLVPEPTTSGPYQEVLDRISAQEANRPEGERTSMIVGGDPSLLPATGSVLVLGGAGSRSRLQPLLSECRAPVDLKERGFSIAGTEYEGATMAVLVSCHRRQAPGSVLTVLYGVTPEAVTKVARLLFFYGWHSTVVFQDGSVLAREEWQTEDGSREVRVDGVEAVR